MNEIAIRVEHLSKRYRLGQIGGGSLREDLNHLWGRVRGKQSPHLMPGARGVTHPGKTHHWALQDVSFEVRRGEIVGVIGRNGAGKSTLLKILSRITGPTAGTVSLRGRVSSLLEVGTGFHSDLTGGENIFLNGAILGMSRREIRRKFDEIVAFAEVEEFVDTPVKRYSTGMYLRLAFAVAAHLESEILVVDEVLAVGDTSFQNKCMGKMGEVATGGRTVLFVSHNMAVIQALCERSVLLRDGMLEAEGSTSDVIEHYQRLGEGTVVQLGIPLSLEKAKRWGGSGVARIDSVLPFDPAQPYPVSPTYRQGDIGFRFQLSGDVARVKGAAISISDLSDRRIVNFNTLERCSDLNLQPGDTVSVIFRGLTLRPGAYKVAFWIGTSEEGHIDGVADHFMLEVLPPLGRRWHTKHDGFYECAADYLIEPVKRIEGLASRA